MVYGKVQTSDLISLGDAPQGTEGHCPSGMQGSTPLEILVPVGAKISNYESPGASTPLAASLYYFHCSNHVSRHEIPF